MRDHPSIQVLAIPEIFCMIIDVMDGSTLKSASRVCKAWYRQVRVSLWRQLVIPRDWYNHDLDTQLWPILDKHGNAVKALSLELSNAAKLRHDVDLNLIKARLAGLLSRTPNLESLNLQVSRQIKSSIVETIAEHAGSLKQFESDIRDWDSTDMATLLSACPRLRHVSGHNFSGGVLEAIATTQPTLNRIDCTRPLFDDEELIMFAQRYPDLLQLSVSLHQFLTTKALIGIAQYCHKIEHLGLQVCLCLQSKGFQAIFQVSTNLRVLDLGPSEAMDGDIALVAARCPMLETLKLPFCGNITDASITAIVHSCRRLRHLDLSWCEKVLLSIFNMKTPWVCKGLRYLDISGIHACYSVEASMASTLLPSMYHQLSLLTQLQHLKLSGHGFSLQLLERGRSNLSRLTQLESLNIEKLKKPLPWEDIIEIGNLFPRIKELQFRSNDVIPPLSVGERLAISQSLEGHVVRKPFTDTQPEPGLDPEVVLGTPLPASTLPSEQAPPQPEAIPGSDSDSDRPRSSKRRRSRSPSPSPTPLLNPADSPSAIANPTQKQSTSLPVSASPIAESWTTMSTASVPISELAASSTEIPPVMKATLQSGLVISFRVNGEDDEGGPDGDEGWSFPPGMSFYD
ncbi:hypothetical protein EDD11_007448 [Mortierella claussenii]|nr:hypothetical protein EDD11_007448 [Mortierella claussenii]